MNPRIRRALHRAGLHVSSFKSYERDRLSALRHKELQTNLKTIATGQSADWASANMQDFFAMAVNGFKRDGFFVEFGATDGKTISNTYTLEKQFGWRGILSEPSRCWHTALTKNRTAEIVYDAVWKETGAELDFDEVAVAELSTLSQFSSSDMHAQSRSDHTSYKVRTISLLDLLKAHNAPPVVDFLSVDTEGSEFDILQAFDFDQYRFNAIVVEHNHTPSRDKIRALLDAAGYTPVHAEISDYDDWFVPISR